MIITNNIRFFFDNTVSFSTETGGILYIDAHNVNGKVCHSVAIWKSRNTNCRNEYDISEINRDVIGRLTNDNTVRYFKLTYCGISREVRYYLGNKKPTFSIEIMFVDDTSRAFTDIQIEFPNRSTARKYFKVVKEGLGIKKGFK